jgi:hypothetical protein
MTLTALACECCDGTGWEEYCPECDQHWDYCTCALPGIFRLRPCACCGEGDVDKL